MLPMCSVRGDLDSMGHKVDKDPEDLLGERGPIENIAILVRKERPKFSRNNCQYITTY